MNINYNSKRQIFKIDTENSSYIMIVRRNGYLQHLYYGATIKDDDIEYLFSDVVNESFSPWAPSADVKFFALDTQPQEYSCNGTGDMRISALAIKNHCGNASTDVRYVSHRIFKGNLCKSKAFFIKVIVTYSLF